MGVMRTEQDNKGRKTMATSRSYNCELSKQMLVQSYGNEYDRYPAIARGYVEFTELARHLETMRMVADRLPSDLCDRLACAIDAIQPSSNGFVSNNRAECDD